MLSQKQTPIGQIGANLKGAISEAISNHYKDSEKNGLPQIFRVENDVYERVTFVQSDGVQRIDVRKRTRKAIAERLGNRYVESTPYYDGFVNIPSHTDYKQVIPNGGNGLYNKYHSLMHQPQQGEHPAWDILIDHIGGKQRELLWDYLTILYRYPTHTLPVLCLASKQNGTGKSTFANALGWMFGQNVTLLTQTDLNSQFNFYVTKLLAVFEEISESKKAINTIKAFSTAKSASLNEKNEKQTNVESFLKILINTNNEADFIRASDSDVRYWIIRVKPLENFDPDFDTKLRNEVPTVMWTLANRAISTPKQSRMWFAPHLLKTDALAAVVENSRSRCAKDIWLWCEDVFDEHPDGFGAILSEITQGLTTRGCRYSPSEIADTLKNEFMLDNPNHWYKNPNGVGKTGRAYEFRRKGEEGKEYSKEGVIDEEDLPF